MKLNLKPWAIAAVFLKQKHNGFAVWHVHYRLFCISISWNKAEVLPLLILLLTAEMKTQQCSVCLTRAGHCFSSLRELLAGTSRTPRLCLPRGSRTLQLQEFCLELPSCLCWAPLPTISLYNITHPVHKLLPYCHKTMVAASVLLLSECCTSCTRSLPLSDNTINMD